ncbi:MAG: hypothetical protein LC121_14015 [Anaerolineae bacterium]|nr:hypothetical protein [Anaerolineae bacterium]
MDENKEKNEQKNYTVEWSFSFEKLGEQIGDFFKSLGDKSEQEIKHGESSEPVGGATLGAGAHRLLGRRDHHQGAGSVRESDRSRPDLRRRH